MRRWPKGYPVLVLALALVTGALALPWPTPAGESEAALLARWVQLGPEGVALARVITTQPACPAVLVDGTAQPMAERAAPEAAYPVRVCELALPPGAGTATVEGQPLPLPPAAPRRIVVIGDTGCRLRGEEIQACNDPQAWPFATVARRAAAEQPDLVVHVGDYLYREEPCPPKAAGCAGSPWGYNWAAWQADFFTPAAPLLQAAPWVFVRGNHELCSRAGGGWFRFLDPHPLLAACQDHTAPYAVPVGALQLLVLDAAAAEDREAPPEQVAVYAAQFDEVRARAGATAWLTMHRPLWAIGAEHGADGALFQTNPTLQAASGNALPPGVQLVLSGHIHLFEVLDFAAEPAAAAPAARPPQLVVGNSGTALDPAVRAPLAGLTVAGAPVTGGWSLHQFGYLVVEPVAEGWTATLRAVDGSTLATCTFIQKRARCAS
jgi:hypothetical protein